ncbi:protein FAM13C-like isoform X1 [Seriola aureovittata]|uniref:protein FAM13C-like isoform X1 n=1 Tax=Seriola aureovittata TaxID=2871759 RepID=UPI0024BE53A2|nr:protein FAM13C-like isoform X1 [Seriola aureovittata]
MLCFYLLPQSLSVPLTCLYNVHSQLKRHTNVAAGSGTCFHFKITGSSANGHQVSVWTGSVQVKLPLLLNTSSLLKLQALEVEGGPSLGPSPEESPPALGSKGQKSPCGLAELGGKEGKTLALCHSADENSPPELLTVLTRPPQSPRHQPLTTIRPGQQPLTPDGVLSPSPHHSPYSPQRSSPGGEGGGGGGGGGEGGGGALLQLLAGGPSPLPSPRCSSLSHSLRFNSDPDTAPSPPCSQQYILSRGRGDRTEGSEDMCPPSIPFLTRQIQTLKKKVRRFEDQFEQEMNYKPSHNDKYSNPEMVRVMSELAKARKQLKELRLRQSVFESKEQDGAANTDVCRYGSRQQGASEHRPTLEETVDSLFRRLREKRQALGLPDNMKEMTQAQMVLEKITLQKCLLYLESLHGRPGTKQERNLVKPLYDRYKMIKHLLCVSPITTIEEEDGSDEDSGSSRTVDELPVPPPPQRATRPAAGEEDSDRDSDPAFVSPLDEVKAVHQQAAVTTANLHEASRSQLLQSLRETRAEKKNRRKALREFEDQFYRQTGRICQKEDRTPMKEEYQEYKQLKAKLRLLEVLLSKQDVTKTM